MAAARHGRPSGRGRLPRECAGRWARPWVLPGGSGSEAGSPRQRGWKRAEGSSSSSSSATRGERRGRPWLGTPRWQRAARRRSPRECRWGHTGRCSKRGGDLAAVGVPACGSVPDTRRCASCQRLKALLCRARCVAGGAGRALRGAARHGLRPCCCRTHPQHHLQRHSPVVPCRECFLAPMAKYRLRGISYHRPNLHAHTGTGTRRVTLLSATAQLHTLPALRTQAQIGHHSSGVLGQGELLSGRLSTDNMQGLKSCCRFEFRIL